MSLHRGLLTGGRVAIRLAPVPADAPVVWIGGAALDEDAHVVWETLTHRDITRYAAVVDDVAERLFRRDLARIGGAADIGFSQPFYRVYARELLAQLDGTFVCIGRPR
jgi:hypothetical protein